jgi:putative endonuclease
VFTSFTVLLMDKFYIGYTANLQERIIRHNQKSKGFTGKVSDWTIVYTEQSEALLRENKSKAGKVRLKSKL